MDIDYGLDVVFAKNALVFVFMSISNNAPLPVLLLLLLPAAASSFLSCIVTTMHRSDSTVRWKLLTNPMELWVCA
jgi:hypothetical protein